MEKQVFFAPGLDEPEAFVRQLLDATFGHCVSLLFLIADTDPA